MSSRPACRNDIRMTPIDRIFRTSYITNRSGPIEKRRCEVKHQEGFLKGVRGANIYFQNWLPEGDPKAVLLVIPGLAEHSGRYVNVVNHFVPLGYAVYGIDHLGHGKSEGKRVYVKQFDDFTDPLKSYFDMITRLEPGKPVFLLGHSLGGLIGVVYLLDHQAELKGAVLSAPLIKPPGNVTPAAAFMSKVFSALLPKFGILAFDRNGVSQDPAVVQAYVDDPLVYRGKITARLTSEIGKAMQTIGSEANRITLPILIVQGSADSLVDPAGARVLFDAVGSADKEIKIYEGFYHEVFNEPGRERVLRDVEAWLEAHLGSRK